MSNCCLRISWGMLSISPSLPANSRATYRQLPVAEKYSITLFFLSDAQEVRATASEDAITTASAALPIIFRAVRRDIPFFSSITCENIAAKISIKTEINKYKGQ